jgi:two-component system response regulator FlrC
MLRRHGAGQPVKLLSEAASAVLMAHDWPGNVRELENVMQRALVLAEGMEIGAEHIMLLTGAEPSLPLRAAA